MKLSIIGALSIFTLFTANAMNHEAHYGWFMALADATELADVPMYARLVSTPGQTRPTTAQPAPTQTPGMLQAICDSINKRPGRTI